MPNRNPNLTRLKAGYLFPEIARRRREFAASHPQGERVISLGVGNTTEALLPHICAGLEAGARALGCAETYSGYMDEGLPELRRRISKVYYGGRFDIDEIFISDGSKCDIGRLQLLFGADTRVCVQDPSYPVYVDGSVLQGVGCKEGAKDGASGYGGITYLPCTAANGYFPDLSAIGRGNLVYFCSPNNPTGAAVTKEQLAALVGRVRETDSFLVYDAAYSDYLRDSALPKTVFEAAGAEYCAIEVNSFSKSAGFTGVRLGWTAVPKTVKYTDGGSLNSDWARIMATIFNGASNIAQAGGLAALDAEGLREIRSLTDFYLGNAALIRSALQKLGVPCMGGFNSPYIWADFSPEKSWDVFNRILEKCRIVTTPGAGFGPAGEGFVRFSAFGHRADVEEACLRLERL
ncbi:MAG: LL-diaminopimelate aminotransferase [Spirochaetaceae bacterium]|jgi:LL-diaminopimelate aminotransferase|nr:LL-diaminopimelate aminotransferase [Spirochaetaceae bacterium]